MPWRPSLLLGGLTLLTEDIRPLETAGTLSKGQYYHHTHFAPVGANTLALVGGLWHGLTCGLPGTAHAPARPREGGLVCRQPQYQPGTQQQSDDEGGEEYTRPGFLLSLSHRGVLLSGRSMPAADHASPPQCCPARPPAQEPPQPCGTHRAGRPLRPEPMQ